MFVFLVAAQESLPHVDPQRLGVFHHLLGPYRARVQRRLVLVRCLSCRFLSSCLVGFCLALLAMAQCLGVGTEVAHALVVVKCDVEGHCRAAQHMMKCDAEQCSCVARAEGVVRQMGAGAWAQARRGVGQEWLTRVKVALDHTRKVAGQYAHPARHFASGPCASSFVVLLNARCG